MFSYEYVKINSICDFFKNNLRAHDIINVSDILIKWSNFRILSILFDFIVSNGNIKVAKKILELLNFIVI